MSAEQRIKDLKLELRQPSAPVANYVNAVRTGIPSVLITDQLAAERLLELAREA